MTNIEETAAVVALLRRGDRPWHHYSDVIEATRSAIAVLEGKFEEPRPLEAPELFGTEAVRTQAPVVDLEPIVDEIEAWLAEGMRVLTVLDDEYPPNLRTIHNRPPLLFIRGELTAEDAQSIAVVGTRRPSTSGLQMAVAMAGELAQHDYTIISGLAEGIDSAAHHAALEAGRRTVAVIGTGLRRCYPAKHWDLQHLIAEGAAVVSQFWPDAPPRKSTFPMRNVVMSGLALATVVIEASYTSGAKMQARFALEHGRPVFLVSSLLEHSWAREYADRPGTHVVDSAADVVERVQRLTSLETLSM